jgi:hypothetical protein
MWFHTPIRGRNPIRTRSPALIHRQRERLRRNISPLTSRVCIRQASNPGVIGPPGRTLGRRRARVCWYPAAALISPAVTIAWAIGAPPAPEVAATTSGGRSAYTRTERSDAASGRGQACPGLPIGPLTWADTTHLASQRSPARLVRLRGDGRQSSRFDRGALLFMREPARCDAAVRAGRRCRRPAGYSLRRPAPADVTRSSLRSPCRRPSCS